jgi:hypothetical protein
MGALSHILESLKLLLMSLVGNHKWQHTSR